MVVPWWCGWDAAHKQSSYHCASGSAQTWTPFKSLPTASVFLWTSNESPIGILEEVYSGPAAARNGQFLKNGANLMDSQQPDQHIGKWCFQLPRFVNKKCTRYFVSVCVWEREFVCLCSCDWKKIGDCCPMLVSFGIPIFFFVNLITQYISLFQKKIDITECGFLSISRIGSLCIYANFFSRWAQRAG